MTSGSDTALSESRNQRDRYTPSLAQCQVAGARHLREGKWSQDAIRAAREGEIVVLAVADGHGTSARGDVGASLAVEVAIEQLLRFAEELGPVRAADPEAVHAHAEHSLRIQLVLEWARRVHGHAGGDDPELRSYGSTLLFALASPDYLLVGQLGDGDILLVDAARRVARPIAPDPNNFADETTSLCQREAWKAFRVHAMPTPSAESLLLLSTDGYSNSYETDEIFELIGPDYLDMFREQGAATVDQMLPEILAAVSAGGSGDDIALGMLHWSRVDGAAERGE